MKSGSSASLRVALNYDVLLQAVTLLCLAAAQQQQPLHNLQSTLSQNIIAEQLSLEKPAGCIPCLHSVDMVTAQHIKIPFIQVCVPIGALFACKEMCTVVEDTYGAMTLTLLAGMCHLVVK